MKAKQNIILLYFCVLLFFKLNTAFSQSIDSLELTKGTCGTDELEQRLMSNPDTKYYFQQYNKINNEFSIMLSNNKAGYRGKIGSLKIVPVVVHVIHKGEAIGTGSNLPEVQIMEAIRGLNERFSNTIGDGLDIEVQFCLATRDPFGCSTNGIIRINGTIVSGYENGIGDWQQNCNSFASELSVKDLSRWSNTDYYNIWIVHNICNGWSGYAYRPSLNNNRYDGTVIKSDKMTYNSAVLTHELGHAFNLNHTFDGDENDSTCPVDTNCFIDGDKICDTPPHKRSDCGTTNNCSSQGIWSNSNINYMSYCATRTRFTNDQKNRMLATFYHYPRQNLLNSYGCIPVSDTLNGLMTSNITSNSAILYWNGSLNQAYVIHFRTLNSNNWSIVSNATSPYVLTGLAPNSTYQWQVASNCINLVSSIKDFTTNFGLITKVFLGGPFIPGGDTMTTALRTMNMLPTKCPYDTTKVLNSFPAHMTDWILIDLVDTSTADTIYSSQCACLLKNGTIQNISGDTILSFSGVTSSYVSIRVKHRNHLSARSRGIANTPGVPISFDFRINNNVYIDPTIIGGAFHNVGLPQLLLDSRYTLWPGDVNRDGQIKYQGSGNDRGLVLGAIGGTMITTTVTGYHTADVNLNGHIKYQGSGNDRGIVLASIGGSVITKVTKAHD